MQVHSLSTLMQMHEWITVAVATMAKKLAKGKVKRPSREVVSAWVNLVRTQQTLLAAVERDLKKAGFPPLVWYDVLLELSRHECGAMRPIELEKHMLLPQYSMSRLVERMAEAGYVERMVCPMDGRGQFVGITAPGRALQKKMGNVYSAAIEQHLGAKLTNAEAESLGGLLAKLN
jgi:DNA-binding MarR family transcriptional regulator